MKQQGLLDRIAPALAGVAGVFYAVEGAIVVRAPQGDSHWHASGYAVEAAFVIALAASIPLLGLLRSTDTRASAGLAWIARIGFAGMLVSAVASLGVGGTTLGPAFVLGLVASIVGLLGLTVDSLRRRAATWWTAPVAFVGLVLSIALGDHGGGILFGIAWIAILAALHEREPSAVPAAA